MKNLAGPFALFCAALLIAKPATSIGQDFFRDLGTSRSSGGIGPVTPSDYTYDNVSPSGLRPLRPGQDLSVPEQTEEDSTYNFALGGFRFGLAVGAGIEYNDNITLADHDRIGDFVFRPVLNIDSEWRMSDLNTLRFNVGLSYAKYFSHSQYDTNGVLISPNSELALTFFVGALKFTLRDRFSYQEDPSTQPDISNTAIYSRYENQAGIDMDWAVNQSFDITVGYDHYNLWTTNNGDPINNAQLQDRSIDTVFIKPSVKLNPAVKLGVNASYSFINFTDSDRSDGYGIMAGPFVEWQVSEFTNLYLEGGYQSLQYNDGSNYNNAAINNLNLTAADAASVQSILQDSENSDSYYIRFEIDNRPSEFFRHRLSFSKTAEIGYDTNFYTLYNVEYDADWKVFEHTEIGPSIFYEHFLSSGPSPEKGDRIGATVGIRYHFTNSLTLGLDYRYLWKNSNLAGADYYQNLVFLSLYYKF